MQEKINNPEAAAAKHPSSRYYWNHKERLREEQRDNRNAANQRYRERNKEKVRAAIKRWQQENPEWQMWKAAKQRAKKDELPFDITKEDITIPEVCPVLGIPLVVGGSKQSDNSPSLDKIIPELGYVKGNVCVISWRANCLKRDGKLEEFIKIVQYLQTYNEMI